MCLVLNLKSWGQALLSERLLGPFKPFRHGAQSDGVDHEAFVVEGRVAGRSVQPDRRLHGVDQFEPRDNVQAGNQLNIFNPICSV
jgi:hypothetical protein